MYYLSGKTMMTDESRIIKVVHFNGRSCVISRPSKEKDTIVQAHSIH